MKTTNPFALMGNSTFDNLQRFVTNNSLRNITIDKFFEQRIRIKSLHNEITSLTPKPIQTLHQSKKDKCIKDGKKARYLLLKYRRGGFTTWEQALSYRQVVTQPNTSCVTLSDTQENTKTIFRMVTLMSDLDVQKPPSLMKSKSHIEVPALNTYFHVGTAGAKAFGRGDNLKRVHGSEVAHWQGGYDVIDNLVAGLTEAARYGEVTFETTANGASGWFYEMYKEAMAGENSWNPLFYAWYMDSENTFSDYDILKQEEFFDTIQDEEKILMDSKNLTIGQMLWRRDKKFELKKLFAQEYPENWNDAFLVRGFSFFDFSMLSNLAKNVKNPLNQRDSIIIWIEPEKDEEYSAGADPAEGNENSDNSVMGILNKKTGEQVAVLRGKWRPDVFARKCIELCNYYNGALFACEVNNHGHSVLNTVINTLHYKHLYYRLKPLDKDKYGGDKKEKVAGWHTNGSTRPLLLDDLNEALEHDYMVVNDTIFIAECKTFVDRGGKYEADKNQKDDSVIAWGIAWQCRKQKKATFYIG